MRSSSTSTPPLVPAPPRAARASCPHCHRATDRTLPFCSYCGLRTAFTAGVSERCGDCGFPVTALADAYCGRCGAATGVAGASRPAPESATVVLPRRARAPRLTLLDDGGDATREIPLLAQEPIVGRDEGELVIGEDAGLASPQISITVRDGAIRVRPLDRSRRCWVFTDHPITLEDGDLLLVGSQLLRYRMLADAPLPRQGDDAARGLGSLTPARDVGVMEQLRVDGTVRDSMHLSADHAALLGREHGDWVFPYDPTMSARHAELRPDGQRVVVRDLGSRNGVGLALRDERAVQAGDRLLVGAQLLRVERD